MSTGVKVSGSFAFALMTGRPELARIEAASLKPEELADYAEFLVRETLAERERLTLLRDAMEQINQTINGLSNTLLRFEDALVITQEGGTPKDVANALANPNGAFE